MLVSVAHLNSRVGTGNYLFQESTAILETRNELSIQPHCGQLVVASSIPVGKNIDTLSCSLASAVANVLGLSGLESDEFLFHLGLIFPYGFVIF
jgi:hypothetical protein